jgi:glycosyltransferase involved in cell wall biosynthesis
MQQRRVLIITYYWPPSGGSGVQRWLKFVKYLRRYGWEPVIYTPENPEYPALDASLSADIPDELTVLCQPIWEPYSWYKSLTGRKPTDTIAAGFASEGGQPSWKERLARWIRGNLFIPDARRFWIRPSVRFLQTYLQQHPVEVIISSGPPHSLHLIAQALQKQALNKQSLNHQRIPWIADFRDPWTQIYWFKDLLLSPRALRRHQQLEASVYRQADRLIVVSPSMLEQLPAEYQAKTTVITNGFDPDDFPAKVPLASDAVFRWVYTGTLVSHQNPEHLWNMLGALLREGRLDPKTFQIQLVGKVDGSVVESIEKAGIASLVDLIPYVSHQEVIRYQQEASALLLLLIKDRAVAKGVLTGKIFEYMASQHPIICLGATDSDAAAILQETGTGVCIEYEDVSGLEQALLRRMAEHRRSSAANEAPPASPQPFPPALERYTREALTAQLAELLRASVDQRS